MIDKEMILFRENNLMAEIELLKIIRMNKQNIVSYYRNTVHSRRLN